MLDDKGNLPKFTSAVAQQMVSEICMLQDKIAAIYASAEHEFDGCGNAGIVREATIEYRNHVKGFANYNALIKSCDQ